MNKDCKQTQVFDPQQPAFHNKVPALLRPSPQVVLTPLTQAVPRHENPDQLLLAPNSGLFVNVHGQLDINWAIVRKQLDNANNSEVGMETDCGRQVTWNISPAQISKGDNLTLNMAGLQPFEECKIVLTYGIDKQYVWSVVANKMGRVEGAKLRITSDIKGTYKVAPLVTCATLVPLVETFEVITGNEDVVISCDGNITIVPEFASITVADGAFGQLRLVVTSTHSSPVTSVALDWTALPDGLVATGSPNSLVEFNAAKTEFRLNPIANFGANAQEVIVINFKATNQTFSDITGRLKIISGAGSYTCAGNIYQAGGGTATITVLAGLEEINKLTIDEFSVTGLTSGAATAGTNLTFTLKVRNSGNTTLTNVSIGSIPLNNGNSAVVTAPANAGILASGLTLAPGAIHTVTAVAAFDLVSWGTATTFTHVINVNASTITGMHGTTPVVSSNSMATSFVLNKA